MKKMDILFLQIGFDDIEENLKSGDEAYHFKIILAIKSI